jgi:hypothetical protein
MWLVAVISWINAFRVLRDPDALQFFGFWMAVATAVAAVGSVVALLLVGFRTLTQDADEHSIHRLT